MLIKKKKKRRKGNPGKGGSFERMIATRLSKWWSGGEHDDIFWRSSSSGARATTRMKRGRRTAGQYGDIAAIHVSGAKFIDMFCIECKTGYAHASIQDVLDYSKSTKPTQWELFAAKAIRGRDESGAYSWLLIVRRLDRSVWVYGPEYLLKRLKSLGKFKERPRPSLQFSGIVRLFKEKKNKRPSGPKKNWPKGFRLTEYVRIGEVRLDAFGMPFDTFLEELSKADILELRRLVR